ncbi:hypothetical protein PYW07_013410 [Mythimna separata]|uniref:Tetraspanin n=1 Tax=Mythimna separata TaxID=271217 RepID=A0AAD7Y676_MYTSE|nr:hypothetical protein PYW07_013410 [Mythimna separata]
MDKRTTKTSKGAAWILWIVNFIVMFVCILTIAFGLWIISSPSTISSVIDASGSSTMKALLQDMLTLQVGIALTAIAIFLFCVCFMGFYGAFTRSPFLLFMYSALVLLLLLLECALLYYFSSNLVEKGLQDDGQWTHAMRLAFKCCEHNTSIPDTKKPPWSCCGPDAYPDNCTSAQMFKKDCHASIVSWLERYQLPIYTSLAVLHVVLSSCSFVRRSSLTSRSYS